MGAFVVLLSVAGLLPGVSCSQDQPEEIFNEPRRKASEFFKDVVFSAASPELRNPCPGQTMGMADDSFADLTDTLKLSVCALSPSSIYPEDYGSKYKNKQVFDFIIIGGGTAGSVIASRLSEVAEWNVLLIEAGGDPPLGSDVPYYSVNLQNTDTDWGYTTEKEDGLFGGFLNQVNRWPRGKVLGGTSTIGSMYYLRGCRRDYDDMVSDGNPGWSYPDVLPYFKKIEDMTDPETRADPLFDLYHSVGGPITLTRVNDSVHMKRAIEMIQSAAFELGFAVNYDFDGIPREGFISPNYATLYEGERINTAKAYLNPVKKRRNLRIIKNAQVGKILICPISKRAHGVEFFYKNERKARVAHASREVIVSAGVVGSPKLLMLSGIGPEEELKRLGIPVIEDLDVGMNLHDRLMFPGIPITIDPAFPERTFLEILDETYAYLTRRSGLFASTRIAGTVGYVNTDDEDEPDIMLHFIHGPLRDSEAILHYFRAIGVAEYLYSQIERMNNAKEILMVVPILLRPKSRGRIMLESIAPDDYPSSHAHYLKHPQDVRNLIGGIRFVEKLAETDSFKKYGAYIGHLRYEMCDSLEPGSEEYWKCALRQIASTNHDQGGTCKMGPATDCSAVVDPLLRVYGIKGLRVADMSVMPRPMGGGSLAAATLIGEMASDFIKEKWLPNYERFNITCD
ncbi:glucose dehydrogenase [FAD, quinone]-like isoform X2 [Cimex lectularius]|nr:glucose dehydrogenase [FAD, quinone]-like isoform X2 [Cimex lectularius]